MLLRRSGDEARQDGARPEAAGRRARRHRRRHRPRHRLAHPHRRHRLLEAVRSGDVMTSYCNGIA